MLASPPPAATIIALAAGLVFLTLGWRAYTGRSRRTIVEGQWAGPSYTAFGTAWYGAGALLLGIGLLLASLPWDLARAAGTAVGLLGLPLLALGTVFMFYLPSWLRPRWLLEYQRQEREQRERQEHADRRIQDFQDRRNRGELGQHLLVPAGEAVPSGELPPTLPVWVALGAPVPSARLAPEVSKVRRPRLALAGRMTGDLPYLELRPEARHGMLWVAPGKLVFVQSDADDRRHDESYVFEVPAAALVDLAPARTPEGRPAIELVAVPETLVFELDGGNDPEELAPRLRGLLAE